ncbi:MAG: hypothetical protein ACI4MT_00895 [Christensenellales bacterium]
MQYSSQASPSEGGGKISPTGISMKFLVMALIAQIRAVAES